MPENAKTGVVIGTLTAEDPDNQIDQIQTFTFTLKDSADGRFKISESGQLLVK